GAPGGPLRPRVSLVPRGAAQEAPPAAALTGEEPLPVVHAVEDEERLPVLEVIRDDEAGPDVRRPIPARFLPHFHVRVTTFWNWSPTIHRVYASGRGVLFIN